MVELPASSLSATLIAPGVRADRQRRLITRALGYGRTISPTFRSTLLALAIGFACLLVVGSLVNGQIGFALLWAAVAVIAAYFQFVHAKGRDSDQQPGWYPNPINLTEERYWDGRRWAARRPAGPDQEAADKSR